MSVCMLGTIRMSYSRGLLSHLLLTSLWPHNPLHPPLYLPLPFPEGASEDEKWVEYTFLIKIGIFQECSVFFGSINDCNFLFWSPLTWDRKCNMCLCPSVTVERWNCKAVFLKLSCCLISHRHNVCRLFKRIIKTVWVNSWQWRHNEIKSK